MPLWYSLNDLDVMNTVFDKKRFHNFTRQHSGSERWHCIDYLIMRRVRGTCDVAVLRSADYWTGHKLLQGQLRIHHPVKKPRLVVRKRFTVGILKNENVLESFNKRVVYESAENNWQSAEVGKRSGR